MSKFWLLIFFISGRFLICSCVISCCVIGMLWMWCIMLICFRCNLFGRDLRLVICGGIVLSWRRSVFSLRRSMISLGGIVSCGRWSMMSLWSLMNNFRRNFVGRLWWWIFFVKIVLCCRSRVMSGRRSIIRWRRNMVSCKISIRIWKSLILYWRVVIMFNLLSWMWFLSVIIVLRRRFSRWRSSWKRKIGVLLR